MKKLDIAVITGYIIISFIAIFFVFNYIDFLANLGILKTYKADTINDWIQMFNNNDPPLDWRYVLIIISISLIPSICFLRWEVEKKYSTT